MCVGYGDREQRFHPNLKIMAAKTTLSATFPNGKTVTRTTARAYTHVVMVTNSMNQIVAWTTDPVGAAKRETSRANSWAGGAVTTDVVAVNV